MNNYKIYFLLLALFLFSCSNTKQKQTLSGMKYTVYRESNGKKPKVGDWVTVQMVYKEDNDSVLFDSRAYGRPLRFALPEPKFAGSFEEGLMYLGEGDSATFYVNADSMYEKVIMKENPEQISHRPKQGSFLKFDVLLMRVQTYQEAEMEIAMNESKQEKAELNALEAYLKEKNITAEKQPEGYYMIMNTPGKGELIKKGSVVAVNFTSSFLNGIAFDSNSKSGKPYTFIAGKGDVIKAWDLAITRLHEGDKVTLIVPSSLAFGSAGKKMPNSLTYTIPPFSTIIFEIEVLKASAVAQK